MVRAIVHPRVHDRHPEIEDADALAAWEGAITSAPRLPNKPDEYVALGFDGHGRLLEVVAVRGADGSWLIYHATTPPSDKTYKELKVER
ncbi:MAG: hypothetical protein Q4C41_02405 [Eggerthellaceae bacterium]|nr:hypothetical protein [Eggerthellaceae bacterium]